MNFVTSCAFTGFLGDLGLQTLDRGTWGLTEYFQKHGKLDSMFIASGMMSIFGGLFVLSTGRPPTYPEAFLYGGSLDLLFRYLRPMTSLNGYYAALSPPVSFVWGGIPFLMALTLSNFTV